MEHQIKEINNRVSQFNLASKKYASQKKMIGDAAYHKLVEFSMNFENDAVSIVENNRKLKIGVVGQIKAGKSSFLNSLLFDGKDLLPKAATPMTAALTVISYSEKPKAEIEFYTSEEWQLLLEKAQKYEQLLQEKKTELTQGRRKLTNRFKQVAKAQTQEQQVLTEEDIKMLVQAPDDIKTAYELFMMAQKNSIQINSFLGTVKSIDHIQDTDQLIGELQQYVGADGDFTPIVKSTKVYIANEALKTIEVIDTPGINDPIISRGQRTREYLGKCDVIFLLSYSGQFMDSVDVELLTQNIPDKGIVNVVLLGSKFDSVLLDTGNKYPNLSQALADVNKKLNGQAHNTIIPIINRFPDNLVLQSLEDSLPPIFISSMAYNIAKEFGDLNKEQEHILSRLQATFPNEQLTPELLRDLSNIDRIKTVELEKVLTNKENILQNRFNNLLEAQNNAFIKELLAIKEELKKDLKRLLNSSGEDLENHFIKIEKGMKQASKKVDLVFSRYITDMQKGFGQMKSDFKESAVRFRKFNETNESRKEVVGTERYGFLWLKKRNVYETRTYTYANVHQTIDNIENLVLDLDKKIKADFDDIIQMKKLSNELKNAIKGIFDLADENFDFEDVIIPVEKTVNKISIPKFEVSSDQYRERIISQFGLGKVEGTNVDKLREMQYRQIDEILTDVEKNIDQTIHEVESLFNKVSIEFINDVLKESQQKKEKLQEELQNLQVNKINYQKVIKELEYDLTELNTNGNDAFRLVNEWTDHQTIYSNPIVEKEIQSEMNEVAATSEMTANPQLLIMGQKVPMLTDSSKLVFTFSSKKDTSLSLDLSAFVCGPNEKVTSESDFIFYNQPAHASKSVEFIQSGTEQSICLFLNQVATETRKIVMTLTVYSEKNSKLNFSHVQDLQLHMFDNQNEVIRYAVDTPFRNETAIVLCEIYRYKDEWKFNAVGQGFSNGLKGLCNLFGVEAE